MDTELWLAAWMIRPDNHAVNLTFDIDLNKTTESIYSCVAQQMPIY